MTSSRSARSTSKRVFFVICSFVLLSCSSLTIPISYRNILARKPLCSDTGNYNPLGIDAEQSIQEEIKEIIQTLVQSGGGVDSNTLSILMENAHILTKGKLYESVIEKSIEECDNNRDVAKIEAVDAIMKGFIVSERKQRSRLKMNYMMSGASSNRLDEAIAMLSESDEIDDSLLNYVDSLIRKEMLRAAGPAATEESEDLLQGVGKDAVDVLRMIKRRLQAEMKTVGRDDLKMLSRLLQEDDLEIRESIIRNNFKLVGDLEEFAVFLSNGISHILETGGVGRSPTTDPRENSQENKEVDLPVGTLEKMKDLMISIEKAAAMLETGLRSGDIYSTNAEDYLDVDLKNSANNGENNLDQ